MQLLATYHHTACAGLVNYVQDVVIKVDRVAVIMLQINVKGSFEF